MFNNLKIGITGGTGWLGKPMGEGLLKHLIKIDVLYWTCVLAN
jgi:hypothetical protein